MKRAAALFSLIIVAGIAYGQSPPRIKSMVAVPITPAQSAAGVASLPKDYEALYQKEAEKTRQLKGEVQTLTARIAEMTRPGGSLVQAYCESPTLSRNTAGASNDCSTSGFACEPVSGLCRTSARSTLECAGGFVYCSKYANCVRTPEEC